MRQPCGLVMHNLAGNAFNVGMLSLMFGLLTKNVNLIKLPREEPYFSVKFAESIAEVDKKIAKEIAVLYWSGSRGEIYDELFNSGFVDCVLAWGGLTSIEDIRRRAYRFGIKMIDHRPKMSFGIISEDVLSDPTLMQDMAQKIAMDVAIWNQKACLSPRVIYIKEKSTQTAVSKDYNESQYQSNSDQNESDNTADSSWNSLKNFNSSLLSPVQDESNITTLMHRSLKLLRNEITDNSPLGFTRLLADAMQNADVIFPRAYINRSCRNCNGT